MLDLFLKRDHRVAGVDVVPTTLLNAARGMGITDSSQTTVAQIRTNNRGIFAACVDTRARAIASAMVGVHGKTGAQVMRRRAGAWEPVEDGHPWDLLLADPSPHLMGYELWEQASRIRDYRGVIDLMVEDNSRGVPIALHPVYPDFGDMLPVPDGMGGVASWIYWRSDGQRIPLEARDVIRLSLPDPTTPYESSSLLHKVAYELDKDLYQQIYTRDTLKEGRFPPSYLSTSQEVTDVQRKQMGKDFVDTYGKLDKVKRVPILSNGMRLEKTPFTPEDLALKDLVEQNTSTLFIVTGVPRAMVDYNSNLATSAAAEGTWLRRVEQEVIYLCAQLTRGFMASFRAARGSLMIQAPRLREKDRLEQARIDEINIRSGVIGPDEVRERESMEESEAPRFISSTLRPLAEATAPPSSFNEPAPEPGGAGGERTRQHVIEQAAQQASPAPPHLTLKQVGTLRAAGRMTDSVLTAEWRAVDRAKQQSERPILAEAASLFAEQGTAVVDAIEREGSSRAMGDPASVSVDTLFDVDMWVAETLERLDPSMRAAIGDGFRAALDRVSVSGTFDPDSPQAQRIADAVNLKLREVPVATRDELNRVILEGMADGASYAELAESVRVLFDGWTTTRAATIARTTATAAFEGGQLEGFREAGIETRRWLTQRDGRARAGHDTADGQEVGLDAPFEVGGEMLDYPGDPNGSAGNVINCRCTALPVTGTRSATQKRNDEIRTRYRALKDRGLTQWEAIGQVIDDMALPLSEEYVRRLLYTR